MAGAAITPELEEAAIDQRVPLYHVILLDDDAHTYDYVIEMLQKLFVFSFQKAFDHASEVDEKGKTIIMTVELPMAEFARDQILAFGPDHRMENSKGSMSAIIEPAESK